MESNDSPSLNPWRCFIGRSIRPLTAVEARALMGSVADDTSHARDCACADVVHGSVSPGLGGLYLTPLDRSMDRRQRAARWV